MDDKNRLERMRLITQRVNNIPTLPEVMTKIIQMVDDPRTTANLLAEYIGRDQALTAKILKLANSAFYGFPQKIGTINLAIVVLGFESVKDLGLSAAVVETFREGEYNGVFDLHHFWVHAVAVAAGCKIVSRHMKVNISGEIFVAGLLHDIGKLILCRHLTEEYIVVIKTAREQKKDIYRMELELLGFNHADVGGWLSEQWNLPQHQTNAIYYHPYPWLSYREPNLAMLVNFANLLANKAGYDAIEDIVAPEMHPKVITYLHLKKCSETEVDWEYYLNLLSVEMEHAKGFLSLLR